MQVTTVGLDLAKRIFQVHGRRCRRQSCDPPKASAIRDRRLLRRSSGLPGGDRSMRYRTSLGPANRSIWPSGAADPPSYVKPYVRRIKTDAADAEAICEAVGRPSMRFVPVKSAHQQAALLHHRARDLLVRQRTMLINAIRGTSASLASSRRRAGAASLT